MIACLNGKPQGAKCIDGARLPVDGHNGRMIEVLIVARGVFAFEHRPEDSIDIRGWLNITILHKDSSLLPDICVAAQHWIDGVDQLIIIDPIFIFVGSLIHPIDNTILLDVFSKTAVRSN